MKITKKEFLKEYAEKSNITITKLLKEQIALPCKCDYEGCKGWAMVANTPSSIKAHKELYTP